ncbi:uncharacterized protein LOC115877147 [Sitophilus oryzae]|uniref:Uncharacterized protein LOC115877147 n=1 Tax=Sitophilus oryzae TaxID=7048 RepID=A0A6J2XCV3_SITOR|nr:uncharacterized protein LOC115877147 [Sitophilus oryzae]XP_030749159.1 uncharacterized protein LOC115877147 [Sitophilus oryzae]
MEHLLAAENSPEPAEEESLVMIELEYQNKRFSTFVSKPLLAVLEADQKTLESYAELVYNREFGEQRNMDCQTENHPSPSSSSKLQCMPRGTLNEEKFQWSPKSTLLLIDIRLSMEQVFIKPTSSKKKLWKSIATKLNEYGYNVSDIQCDNKFRNLLYTYRVNKKKQKTSGEGSLTWEYFEKFDEVLSYKESSHPSTANLGVSMTLPKSKNFTNENISPSCSPCSTASFNPCSSASITDTLDEEPNITSCQNTEFTVRSVPQTPVKKKQEILSMGRYFYLKNKRIEELEKKKEEFRKQKWADEKELKLKEIEAINNLADAIRSSQ